MKYDGPASLMMMILLMNMNLLQIWLCQNQDENFCKIAQKQLVAQFVLAR